MIVGRESRGGSHTHTSVESSSLVEDVSARDVDLDAAG